MWGVFFVDTTRGSGVGATNFAISMGSGWCHSLTKKIGIVVIIHQGCIGDHDWGKNMFRTWIPQDKKNLFANKNMDNYSHMDSNVNNLLNSFPFAAVGDRNATWKGS